MRIIRFRACVVALALACHARSTSSAAACAYHGAKGVAEHPGSFDLAIAIQIAEEAGTIEMQLAPPAPSIVAYHSMVKQLEQFRDLLRAAEKRVAPQPTFSLLLIDSALWSRFTPQPEGLALAIHTAGPSSAEPAVLTSGAVIRSLLQNRLSSADALHRGLIRVEARIDAKLRLFELLAAAKHP